MPDNEIVNFYFFKLELKALWFNVRTETVISDFTLTALEKA